MYLATTICLTAPGFMAKVHFLQRDWIFPSGHCGAIKWPAEYFSGFNFPILQRMHQDHHNPCAFNLSTDPVWSFIKLKGNVLKRNSLKFPSANLGPQCSLLCPRCPWVPRLECNLYLLPRQNYEAGVKEIMSKEGQTHKMRHSDKICNRAVSQMSAHFSAHSQF